MPSDFDEARRRLSAVTCRDAFRGPAPDDGPA
jgi:hypothetical protein